MRKISNKERKYLSWQISNITWRQFWEGIQGKKPHWMTTTQYGGEWLDKKMNEPIGAFEGDNGSMVGKSY